MPKNEEKIYGIQEGQKNNIRGKDWGQLTISVLPQGGNMGPDLVHQDFSLQMFKFQIFQLTQY